MSTTFSTIVTTKKPINVPELGPVWFADWIGNEDWDRPYAFPKAKPLLKDVYAARTKKAFDKRGILCPVYVVQAGDEFSKGFSQEMYGVPTFLDREFGASVYETNGKFASYDDGEDDGWTYIGTITRKKEGKTYTYKFRPADEAVIKAKVVKRNPGDWSAYQTEWYPYLEKP